MWLHMRFAIDLPIFGQYCDPRLLGELARDAENAGWDGCFIWDHIHVGNSEPVADPWIALATIALATERIRIGPMVTPLYRRYPWKLARECVSIDHLSGGRLILGVGLGDDWFGEISTFDGPLADQERAKMLDEGLEILLGLWSGDSFAFNGTHFRVRETRFLPRPIQSPRIPLWVAGSWPNRPPFRRAARYDGVVAVAGNVAATLTAAQVCQMIAYTRRFRAVASSFDVVQFGETHGTDKTGDRELAATYAAAGVTWWLESIFPRYSEVKSARARILRGPPSV
jgi:alkanesulfonate monooxygenase SsuD/methylene tetrahydromethanopterin reductase-like flavin-dependent oxidoreductase (luciferase family)